MAKIINYNNNKIKKILMFLSSGIIDRFDTRSDHPLEIRAVSHNTGAAE